MSAEIPAVVLTARSALGVEAGAPGREVFQGAGLKIIEEAQLPVYSLRRSRITHDKSWLPRILEKAGLAPPGQARQLVGDARLACLRIEPHAWLVTGQLDTPFTKGGAGWLVTELTDGCSVFRLKGQLAFDLLSGGGNLHGISQGMGCRMPFAETCNVVIQCFAADEYRLIADVSFGPFLESWLADGCCNLSPLEDRA